MHHPTRAGCGLAHSPARQRMRGALALVGALAALCTSPVAADEIKYRSDCQVTDTTRLEKLGRDGRAAHLSHFTCHITGGPLDGSVVTGTNIWDMGDEGGGALLGSIAVAQKTGSSVMYEVHDVTRSLKFSNGRAVGWEATSWGIYKAASGSAAPLAGKTFSSVARFTSPRTFTIENTIND